VSAPATNGQDHRGLKADVASHLGQIDAREVNSIPIGTDAEGRQIVVRVGRYGPYLQRDEERAGVPDGLAPDELTIGRAEELLEAPSGDRTLGVDPESGLAVIIRSGRFGPYVQLGEMEGHERPRTSSLFKTMSPDTLTFSEALALLSLPRAVGTDPGSGEQIQALNGRFGPYLKKGSDTRSLGSEEQLLTITLEEALDLFSRPRVRRGRVASAPLRELGPDPETGGPMVVRVGRYGPYVTDGTTNVSLRKDDEPETITADRAAELLAERRAAGPPIRRARRATSTKKAVKATKATKVVKAAKVVKATKTPRTTKTTEPGEPGAT
jgi:DNA topoisomerase-1